MHCDGVHPIAEGYKLIATLVFRTLFDPGFDSKEQHQPNKVPKDQASELIALLKMTVAISICVFCTVKVSKMIITTNK